MGDGAPGQVLGGVGRSWEAGDAVTGSTAGWRGSRGQSGSALGDAGGTGEGGQGSPWGWVVPRGSPREELGGWGCGDRERAPWAGGAAGEQQAGQAVCSGPGPRADLLRPLPLQPPLSCRLPGAVPLGLLACLPATTGWATRDVCPNPASPSSRLHVPGPRLPSLDTETRPSAASPPGGWHPQNCPQPEGPQQDSRRVAPSLIFFPLAPMDTVSAAGGRDLV